MKVTFYGYEDEVKGTVELVAGQLIASNGWLQELLKEPLFIFPGNEEITAEEDPELYLEQLQYEYKGSALRASGVHE